MGKESCTSSTQKTDSTLTTLVQQLDLEHPNQGKAQLGHLLDEHPRMIVRVLFWVALTLKAEKTGGPEARKIIPRCYTRVMGLAHSLVARWLHLLSNGRWSLELLLLAVTVAQELLKQVFRYVLHTFDQKMPLVTADEEDCAVYVGSRCIDYDLRLNNLSVVVHTDDEVQVNLSLTGHAWYRLCRQNAHGG